MEEFGDYAVICSIIFIPLCQNVWFNEKNLREVML